MNINLNLFCSQYSNYIVLLCKCRWRKQEPQASCNGSKMMKVEQISNTSKHFGLHKTFLLCYKAVRKYWPMASPSSRTDPVKILSTATTTLCELVSPTVSWKLASRWRSMPLSPPRAMTVTMVCVPLTLLYPSHSMSIMSKLVHNCFTTITTTRSTSVDLPTPPPLSPSLMALFLQPTLSAIAADSLWGPWCPPLADQQMCEAVLRCSFCHASVPTEPNR